MGLIREFRKNNHGKIFTNFPWCHRLISFRLCFFGRSWLYSRVICQIVRHIVRIHTIFGLNGFHILRRLPVSLDASSYKLYLMIHVCGICKLFSYWYVQLTVCYLPPAPSKVFRHYCWHLNTDNTRLISFPTLYRQTKSSTCLLVTVV